MKRILFAGLLTVLIGGSAFCAHGRQVNITPVPDTSGIGLPHVPFSMTTPEGKVLDSEKLKGKVMVLDFWATWCAPCRKLTHEIDSLVQPYHKKKDFLMIGVSFRENKKEAAAAYWQEHKYQFPMASDNDVFGGLIKAGNPTILVIDKKGIVRGRWDKYTATTAQEVKEVIDGCL